MRRKDLWCRAVVSQRGNEFVCGSVDHINPPEAGLLKRTVIAAKVRVEAIQHPYRASGDIIEDAFSITNENDFNLPNQQYLQRASNLIRQKLRPAEPKDLTFEIDQRFLGCEDFIQGDVRVENERHILLATPLASEGATEDGEELVPGWDIQDHSSTVRTTSCSPSMVSYRKTTV